MTTGIEQTLQLARREALVDLGFTRKRLEERGFTRQGCVRRTLHPTIGVLTDRSLLHQCQEHVLGRERRQKVRT